MSSAATSVPGQPMPLLLLLDRAVALSRHHFKVMYPTVAIPLALIAGIFPLAQGALMRSTAAGAPPNPARMIAMGGGMVAAFVLLMAGWLFGSGALGIAAVDAASGRPVSMGRAWRMVARPRVWGTLLLSSLAFAAGLMCCLLPGIYAGLVFSLVVPVMVEDGLFGTAALSRSAALAQYNPRRDVAADPRGKAFLIAFVGTIMGYALTLLAQLPFVIAQQIYVFRMAAGGREADPATMMAAMTWFQVPSTMAGSLAQTAVHLYIAMGLALLYLDTRGRKEGLDLEAAVARLEGERVTGRGDAVIAPGPLSLPVAEGNRELLARVLRESRVAQEIEKPGWQEYLPVAIAAALRRMWDALRPLRSMLDLSADDASALFVGFLVVVLFVLLVVLMRLMAGRRARQAPRAAAPAPAAMPPVADAAEWRRILEARLVAGDVAGALEALWWVLALSVATGEVQPSWTSGELLARARRHDLRPFAVQLDRFRYGPAGPVPSEVRDLAVRLDRALA